MSEPTIMIKVKWASFQPDYRQYKPANPLILTDLTIGVEVPLTSEFIYNATAISIQQMSNAKQDDILLTPMGMRYIIDQLEAVMSNGTKKETTESTGDDEWTEVEEETPTETAKKAENDDEWADETDEPEVEKPDENWNEDWS